MFRFLRAHVSHVIGAFVGGLVGAGASYVQQHIGLTLDQRQQDIITSTIIVGVASLTHKAVAQITNPLNAAQPDLVEEAKGR